MSHPMNPDDVARRPFPISDYSFHCMCKQDERYRIVQLRGAHSLYARDITEDARKELDDIAEKQKRLTAVLRLWCELSLDAYQKLLTYVPDHKDAFEARIEVLKDVLSKLGAAE